MGKRLRRKDKTYRLSSDVFLRLHEYLSPGKEKIKSMMVKHQNKRDESKRLRLVKEYRFEVLQDAIFNPQLEDSSRWGRWPQDRAYRIEQARAEMYDIKTLEVKLKG